uniref:Transposase-associated domain-containing protein n=1 Tax=Cucumis melo TaxID=3656 RepID=A0A9I9EJ40_CUCME
MIGEDCGLLIAFLIFFSFSESFSYSSKGMLIHFLLNCILYNMDKSWMQKNRTSSEYAYGVEMFIKNGLKHSKTSNVMACPCLKCVNTKTLDVNTIRDHLFFNGIDQNYQEWIFHGESLPIKRNNESVFSSVKEEIDEDDVDDTIGMFEAAHNYFNDKSENFEELVDDANKPLYPNCTNFTKISTLIKIYNLKTKFGWSDKSFTELLQLICDILPTPNECTTSTYEAKKILCTLGMKYEKIHACRNDCCLFRKELSDANMEDSSEDEREMLLEVRKKSFVPRGPTTMSELASVRNFGQKLPIQFNEHGQPVGATSKKMQSYIGVCVWQQIPITYNSWKEVPNELKDKIYDCISMSFDLQPNAKHSILMERRSKCVYNRHMSRKGYANLADELKITHDVSYRSTLWKKAQKGRNNDYFDEATRDCASRIDELVATHKNEDILTDTLGSKEHGGHGTPCQLSIGIINNIVAVATIVVHNIGCPNVKVLVDVVTGENLTIPNPVKGKIETLNQALGNIIEWPRRLNLGCDRSIQLGVLYFQVLSFLMKVESISERVWKPRRDEIEEAPRNRVVGFQNQAQMAAKEPTFSYLTGPPDVVYSSRCCLL